jgi:hypothetical protein
MPFLSRTLSAVCAVCLLGTTLPLPVRAAAPSLITTQEALDAGSVQGRLGELLAREDVALQLLAHGVDPAQVQARIDALTADEARLLAERLDTLPAGGDVLGVLFAVFIVLLITDILGLTKVFPFTRPIR